MSDTPTPDEAAEVERLRAVAEAAGEYRRTTHTYVQHSRPERDAWADLLAALDAWRGGEGA